MPRNLERRLAAVEVQILPQPLNDWEMNGHRAVVAVFGEAVAQQLRPEMGGWLAIELLMGAIRRGAPPSVLSCELDVHGEGIPQTVAYVRQWLTTPAGESRPVNSLYRARDQYWPDLTAALTAVWQAQDPARHPVPEDPEAEGWWCALVCLTQLRYDLRDAPDTPDPVWAIAIAETAEALLRAYLHALVQRIPDGRGNRPAKDPVEALVERWSEELVAAVAVGR